MWRYGRTKRLRVAAHATCRIGMVRSVGGSAGHEVAYSSKGGASGWAVTGEALMLMKPAK